MPPRRRKRKASHVAEPEDKPTTSVSYIKFTNIISFLQQFFAF